jgi:predicted ArsR family transcriptional regulator
MPGPRSPRDVDLAADTRASLVHLTRSPSVPAGQARRARIVLLAAERVPLRRIAEQVGVDRKIVRRWLDRFRARGLAGLQDLPRPGRARVFSP